MLAGFPDPGARSAYVHAARPGLVFFQPCAPIFQEHLRRLQGAARAATQNCLALFPRQSQKIFLRQVCFGNSEEHQQVILRLFFNHGCWLWGRISRRVFNLRGLLNKRLRSPALRQKQASGFYNFKNHEHKSQAISALLAACQISSRPLRSATAMVFSSAPKAPESGFTLLPAIMSAFLCRSFSRTRQQEGTSGVI